MVRFHIGQRVRIVGRAINPKFLGETGTVIGHVSTGPFGLCAKLQLDNHPVPAGTVWAAPESQLAPIDDDRAPNTVTSWDALKGIYQPKLVAA